jgi:hypothetical protein
VSEKGKRLEPVVQQPITLNVGHGV